MFKDAARFIQSILLAALLVAPGMHGISAAPEANFALEFSIGNEMFWAPAQEAPPQAPLFAGDGAPRAGLSAKWAGTATASARAAGSTAAGDGDDDGNGGNDGDGAAGADGADVDGDLDGDDVGLPTAGPAATAPTVVVRVSAPHACLLAQCVMVPLVPPPRHLSS